MVTCFSVAEQRPVIWLGSTRSCWRPPSTTPDGYTFRARGSNINKRDLSGIVKTAIRSTSVIWSRFSFARNLEVDARAFKQVQVRRR